MPNRTKPMKSPVPILIVDDRPKNLAVIECVLDSPEYQLVILLDERDEAIGWTERLSHDDLEPDLCLAEFLQGNLHLVNEIVPRFLALGFAVVWCR